MERNKVERAANKKEWGCLVGLYPRIQTVTSQPREGQSAGTILEKVRRQPRMMRLLPGILSFLTSTFLVYSTTFFQSSSNVVICVVKKIRSHFPQCYKRKPCNPFPSFRKNESKHRGSVFGGTVSSADNKKSSFECCSQ